MNRFRGPVEEMDLRNTLTEIYKNMFDFSTESPVDNQDIDVLEEIKKELIQEEFEW